MPEEVYFCTVCAKIFVGKVTKPCYDQQNHQLVRVRDKEFVSDVMRGIEKSKALDDLTI